MSNLKNLNIEELLQQLESSPEKKQFNTDGVQGDVLKFFNAFNLIPGKDKIPARTLIRIYRTWSKEPVTHLQFTTTLRDVFTRENNYILVDEQAFAIKREDWVHFYSKKRKERRTSPKQMRQFDAFLKYFNIEAGETPVNIESIHLLYSRFLNERKTPKQLNKENFVNFMKLYFKETITTYSSYYHVSDKIWNSLSREVYNEKEKNQKKFKKVSRPNS